MSHKSLALKITLTSITNLYLGNYFEWRFIWIYTCCNFRIYPMWSESYHEKLSTTNWIRHLGSFDKSRLESEINNTLFSSHQFIGFIEGTCSLKGQLEPARSWQVLSWKVGSNFPTSFLPTSFQIFKYFSNI